MRNTARITCTVTALVGGISISAQAAVVANYWDFSGYEDVVGGALTFPVGTPDLSIHPIYDEAYPGAGPSLNSTLGTSSYVSADILSGGDMSPGMGDFALSYWSYNADDGNSRKPMVMDCLDGTDWGFQIAGVSDLNFRLDDVDGNTVNSQSLDIVQALDVWTHFAINIDRANDTMEVYVNGSLAGSTALGLTGSVEPSQFLELGVINGGGSTFTAQEAGLDDFAYYEGLLSQTEIEGLASGTLTPDQIPVPGVLTLLGIGGLASLRRHKAL